MLYVPETGPFAAVGSNGIFPTPGMNFEKGALGAQFCRKATHKISCFSFKFLRRHSRLKWLALHQPGGKGVSQHRERILKRVALVYSFVDSVLITRWLNPFPVPAQLWPRG